MGLGNPGPEYDDTRHNVGWWALDRIAHDGDFGSFAREGPALFADGAVGGLPVRLVKPLTYMNRSGEALAFLSEVPDFDVTSELFVLVDDANLEVGRLRVRPSGGPGGHRGLRSIESALGTRDYARLRIGVGRPPEGVDWSDWVLSSLPPEEEDEVLALLPTVVEAVEVWIEEGVEVAMNRFNR